MNTRTNLWLVVAGALGTFFVAFSVAYALPLLDPEVSTPGPQTVVFEEQAAAGKSVYDSQGCVFCHTQQVRPVSNDIGLGPATSAGRFADDPRSSVGLVRIGPDLACVGDRLDETALRVSLLGDPEAEDADSVMPAYEHLSQDALSALIAYLSALTCGG